MDNSVQFPFPRLRALLQALALCGGIGLLLEAPPAAGQPADTLHQADARLLARVPGASAVGVDPSGRIYVADAARSRVLVLAPDGQPVLSLGGRGSRAGAFDGPADVDPTNGLSILVADAGNGRIQRFSREGRFLEALPVGRVDPASSRLDRQPVYDVGRDGNDARADGEPIAVASSRANETYAVEAREGVVVAWDAQRRPARVIGGFESGPGALQTPVALAVSEDRLFVADRAQNAVFVYDAFGTYVRRIQPGDVSEVVDLVVHAGRLWIVCPTRVFVTRPEGDRLRTMVFALNAPVDAAAMSPEGRLVVVSGGKVLEMDPGR